MKHYYGVVVDMLTRTTHAIEGDHENKPDKEFCSSFCFCKWFGDYQNTVDEILQLTYEIEIIKMFQRLNKENPSIFAGDQS
ncbi:MAG: hypothetical protein M0Q91_17670 [Methanoregula sp.]|jgi:hypothetical protein|nr:hypothetical protein [Methanoregula sp.]